MAPKETCPIVGVGASAGGLEALETLLRATPERPGLAFVVITHLLPGHESALPDILGRFTPMPVLPARDGEAVRPDHVYAAGPDAILTVRGGKLRVRGTDPARHERDPVNAFLVSLAEDQAERAIAVILSGAGSDGTLGLMAVKEAGGLTIAQGPDGAGPRHDGMPSSAIAAGLVDLVLPAGAIPGRLVEYVRDFGALEGLVPASERAAGSGRTAAAREAICAVLRDRVGHDFAGYKERTFMRRVQRRMQVLRVGALDAYVERLRDDPGEVERLFRDLLIGVTAFFRDPEAFEALGRLVVPRLLEGKGAGDTVRVWVPGCSTGEEAYSIAILLREHADELGVPPKVQVFASDIDEAALKVARAARYPASALEGLSPERRARFFAAEGETYQLSRQVRDVCVFSPHSLIRDPPYSRLDLVSCRNLLIYLGEELQQRVVPVFHYALRPGGFLFLGGAEGVTRHGDLFAPVDKKARIFRRRDHASPPLPFPLFVPGRPLPPAGANGVHREPVAAGPTLRRAVEAEVLELHAPAHVVVNRDGDTVYHSPRVGKYLQPAVGQPSRQVLAMARKGLRLDLRLALEEAAETRRAAVRERVAVELDDGRVQPVSLTVAPLAGHDRGGPLFLVLFADLGPPLARGEEAARGHPAADGSAAVRRLELELRDTRERLQATIEQNETAMEELKSANEELVSLNEELQSTNEELETSKEEIQSVNEELQTVNHELGAKVEQLNQANGDLRNLFESTGIGILFLDRHLAVRSFTPAVTGLFSLIPADRGRPLADIAGRLDRAGLQDDLAAVLAGGGPVERRVGGGDGRAHYLMRVLPYRDDGAVDGAVVTFVDITAMVEAERRQQVLVHELDHRVRNMLTVVAAIARQTAARSSSVAGFEEALLGRVEALGRAYGLVTRERGGDVALGEVVREELEPHVADGGDRVATRGPGVMLRSRAAVALGLVLHELATNAVKHGALSSAEGRVAVEWRVEELADGRRLILCWEEAGGPPVRGPGTRGFGSELIEHQVGHDLGGEVATDFRPRGLAVRLVVPWTADLFG